MELSRRRLYGSAAFAGVTCLLLGLAWLPCPQGGAQGFPQNVFHARKASRHIQRTMTLLATSRPQMRKSVRILFYGQSITEQGWVVEVERNLRRTFPHADLVIENRALGGFPSQRLVKTAETDVYSFYPDLLVFHAYGAHDKYADLIQRVRERTTAEIMIQTDHVTHDSDFTEQTQRDLVRIDSSPWSEFMNQRWLPEVADRFQTGLCDPRAVWKRYLKHYGLAPSALLQDEIHPNAHGDYLLAESVKDCLVRDRRQTSPAEDWVRSIEVGKDVDWGEGVLRVPFTGNRVDVVFDPAQKWPSDSYRVLIDGKPPSEWRELYSLTRALSPSAGKWPLIVDIGAEAARIDERFRLEVETLSREPERYAFRLFGSKTGFDGDGRSDKPFVSNSKRVIISPENWWARYAMELAGRQVPERFEISWNVIPRGVDQFWLAPPGRRGSEASITLAQGLPNGPHLLELRGAAQGIASLRIYRPPLTPEP